MALVETWPQTLSAEITGIMMGLSNCSLTACRHAKMFVCLLCPLTLVDLDLHPRDPWLLTLASAMAKYLAIPWWWTHSMWPAGVAGVAGDQGYWPVVNGTRWPHASPLQHLSINLTDRIKSQNSVAPLYADTVPCQCGVFLLGRSYIMIVLEPLVSRLQCDMTQFGGQLDTWGRVDRRFMEPWSSFTMLWRHLLQKLREKKHNTEMHWTDAGP